MEMRPFKRGLETRSEHGPRAAITSPAGETEPHVSWIQWLAAVIASVLSLASIAMVVAWLKTGGNGFGLSDPDQRFNLHPLSMVLAIGFLATNSVLSWRLWPFPHNVRKAIHIFLNTATLALIGFGLYIVFSIHRHPHVSSMHSWIGLATAFLFAVQALLGLVYLGIGTVSQSAKEAFLPLHAWLGVATYTLGMVTVVSGVINLVDWMIAGNRMKYTDSANYMAGALGIFLYATLFFVLYAVLPRRKPTYEAEVADRTRGASSTAGHGYGAGADRYSGYQTSYAS